MNLLHTGGTPQGTITFKPDGRRKQKDGYHNFPENPEQDKNKREQKIVKVEITRVEGKINDLQQFRYSLIARLTRLEEKIATKKAWLD